MCIGVDGESDRRRWLGGATGEEDAGHYGRDGHGPHRDDDDPAACHRAAAGTRSPWPSAERASISQ
jgi:hypothetical protein